MPRGGAKNGNTPEVPAQENASPSDLGQVPAREVSEVGAVPEVQPGGAGEPQPVGGGAGAEGGDAKGEIADLPHEAAQIRPPDFHHPLEFIEPAGVQSKLDANLAFEKKQATRVFEAIGHPELVEPYLELRSKARDETSPEQKRAREQVLAFDAKLDQGHRDALHAEPPSGFS